IHRGIAPQTVFINEKLQTRLIAFAISAARTYGSEINYEVFSGYAAPEQYNMLERQGSWTDVYGLSALLYKALTGLTPVQATERLINDTLAAPKIINRDIPSNISDAIVSGMTLNPEERIKNVDDLALSLSGSHLTARSGRKGARRARSDALEKQKKIEKKERKRRFKRLAVISSVTVILVTFTAAVIVAAIHPELFERWTSPPPAPTTDASETETRTAAPSPPTEKTDKPPEEIELYAVRDFVGERYLEGAFEEGFRISGVRLLTFKIEREYNDDTERGRIFYQSEPPGSEVPLGTEITLKVSKGPASVKLPPYDGLTVEAYKSLLEKRGITNIKIEDAQSDTVQEGFVAGCNFDEGDEVRTDDEPDEVIIYAARPPAPQSERRRS
ncbi:MAG: PASTA domain-containing protein, partial [Oscillospiraceae bacterium]|nr:PASTA domain-containing protein [Oscillospiraceae bacterium]